MNLILIGVRAPSNLSRNLKKIVKTVRYMVLHVFDSFEFEYVLIFRILPLASPSEPPDMNQNSKNRVIYLKVLSSNVYLF